jgi:hypothetical protein
LITAKRPPSLSGRELVSDKNSVLAMIKAILVKIVVLALGGLFISGCLMKEAYDYHNRKGDYAPR